MPERLRDIAPLATGDAPVTRRVTLGFKLSLRRGLDFVVNGEPNRLRPVARLEDPGSGRVMTLTADQSGVQFYTGNFLNGSHKGKGATYVQYAGLCLETQKFPNAINVPAWQDQVILRPGQPYRHVMVHAFSTAP